MVLNILTQITAKSFCIKRQALHKKKSSKIIIPLHILPLVKLIKVTNLKAYLFSVGFDLDCHNLENLYRSINH